MTIHDMTTNMDDGLDLRSVDSQTLEDIRAGLREWGEILVFAAIPDSNDRVPAEQFESWAGWDLEIIWDVFAEHDPRLAYEFRKGIVEPIFENRGGAWVDWATS